MHINPGGEIEKRKAFGRVTGLTGTYGLLALSNKLMVFGSGTAASVGFSTDLTLLGQTVSYQQLVHPDGSTAMTSVVAATQFGGNAVVAAQFGVGGKIFGYYNGTLIYDLTDGLILAHLSTNTLIATALTAAINRTANYTAANGGGTSPTITISGTNGNGYLAAKSNVTSAGTVTLTKLNEAVPAILGAVSVGQFTIVKGSAAGTGYSAGTITAVTVNGTDILNATITWTTSDENTALLTATAINTYSNTSGYTAVNRGKSILISSAASSADLNGRIVAVTTQNAMCVDSCGFSFAGTAFVLTSIVADTVSTMTLVHPYPSVATASRYLGPGTVTLSRTSPVATATVTTSLAHQLQAGDTVVNSGFADSTVNGTFTVLSGGLDSTHFTFTSTGTSTLTNVVGTVTTNKATITTGTAHGLYSGDSVTISGMANTTFNGTFTLTAVPSTTTFVFSKTNANIASAADTGGTVLIEASLATFYQRLVRDINSTSDTWCAATDGKKLYLSRGQVTVAGVVQPNTSSIIPDSVVVAITTGTVAVTTDDSATLVVNLSKSSIIAAAGGYGNDVTIGPVTASVSGGLAPYAYEWQKVTGNAAISCNVPNAATTTFHATVYTLTVGATYVCKVTDAAGLVAFSQFLGVTATP